MTNREKLLIRRYIKDAGLAMAAARAGITYATLLRVLDGGKVHAKSLERAQALAAVLADAPGKGDSR